MSDKFIYLVRHGKYLEEHANENKKGRLDSIGRSQARKTGVRLKTVPIDSMTSSTMIRAIETAGLIQEHCGYRGKIAQTDLLRECLPTIPPRYKAQLKAPRAKLAKAKQQLDDAYERFFTKARGKKDQHHVLVCHGNVIRYLLVKALGANPHLWGSLYINHGSISIIRLNNKGDATLLLYNNVDFMPRKLKTDSGTGLMLNFL